MWFYDIQNNNTCTKEKILRVAERSLSSPVIRAIKYVERVNNRVQQDARLKSRPPFRGLRKYELSCARGRDLICVLAGDTIWDLINAKLCKCRQRRGDEGEEGREKEVCSLTQWYVLLRRCAPSVGAVLLFSSNFPCKTPDSRLRESLLKCRHAI